MRSAHVGRASAALCVTAVTLGGLTACFMPQPPPVPQAPNTDPITPGGAGAADVREGFIARDGTTTLELQIDERSAVVLTAGSPDGEDLTMWLTGEGVDLENDDNDDAPDGFAFETGSRNPLIAAVLEPGSYEIGLAEYGGDRTAFQLQVLTSTTVVAAGESADLEVAPGEPALAIVTLATGRESIGAVADFDSVLWALVPESRTPYEDDDSGGDRNPLIALFGEQPQDIVVLAASYDGEDTGSLQLSVE